MTENLVLGSESMIGRHLTRILPKEGLYGSKHSEFNLLNYLRCSELFTQYKVGPHTTVYNLVGYNGGLPLNLSKPADIFYQSTQLNLNVLKCCQEYNVKKVVSIISACSYPSTDYAMKEEDLMNGYPNPSVECHGFAKRTILEFSRQLYKQYNTRSISTVLTNCYGDGDRFDLTRTKVVGAAVRRLCDAKENGDKSVTFYGTGNPVRELMSGDAAHCLIQIAENYDDYMNPINLGSDQLFSIKELVSRIVKIVGYTGKVVWDLGKPDGQMMRMLDNSKMHKYVNHKMTDFDDGLKKTIEYYETVGRYLDR